MTNEYRRLFARYHKRAIAQAESGLTKTNDPNTIAKLNLIIDAHTARIHALDREAQTADRKAGATWPKT